MSGYGRTGQINVTAKHPAAHMGGGVSLCMIFGGTVASQSSRPQARSRPQPFSPAQIKTIKPKAERPRLIMAGRLMKKVFVSCKY